MPKIIVTLYLVGLAEKAAVEGHTGRHILVLEGGKEFVTDKRLRAVALQGYMQDTYPDELYEVLETQAEVNIPVTYVTEETYPGK